MQRTPNSEAALASRMLAMKGSESSAMAVSEEKRFKIRPAGTKTGPEATGSQIDYSSIPIVLNPWGTYDQKQLLIETIISKLKNLQDQNPHSFIP